MATTGAAPVSTWREGTPTLVGATRVGGRLGETPVKGTTIPGARLGGDAKQGDGDADGRRTGAENDLVGTAPGALQGPQILYTKDAETGECAQCAKGYVTRPDHRNEHGIEASASVSSPFDEENTPDGKETSG